MVKEFPYVGFEDIARDAEPTQPLPLALRLRAAALIERDADGQQGWIAYRACGAMAWVLYRAANLLDRWS